jgi:hypothetical protein
MHCEFKDRIKDMSKALGNKSGVKYKGVVRWLRNAWNLNIDLKKFIFLLFHKYY